MACHTAGRAPRLAASTRTRCPPRCAAQPFSVARSAEEDAAVRSATAFHLAVPVHDLSSARAFYGDLLGLEEGRRSARWQDYNMYGHQLVCHLVEGYSAVTARNAVDGDPVPVPHFGLALQVSEFHALTSRLRERGATFELEPHLRFKGAPGEQWCAFLFDPSGNALELKAMTTPGNLFARYAVA